MTLEIQNVSCGYGRRSVVSGVNLAVNSGEIMCLLGPNGVGKTTLFKSVLGLTPMLSGSVLLDGENISAWPPKKKATMFGYVPQSHSPPFPFTVLDVVTMGRTAHLRTFDSPSERDRLIAAEQLSILGIENLADRIYTQLSGGERQLVLIARALAQMPKFLFMDEPTSNLDFGNQVRVLRQIGRLADLGLGIIMTSHFPDHVLLCHAKAALMRRDQALIIGNAEDVITEQNLKETYGIDVVLSSIQYPDGRTVKSCVPVV